MGIEVFHIRLGICEESSIYLYCISCYVCTLPYLMQDHTLDSLRLSYEHPEILEIDSTRMIDYQISSLQSTLILLPLVGIEMMWDRSTPEGDP